MATESIEEKVVKLIVEHQGVREDQVVPEARFVEDLGADSLDVVELVMAFEDTFEMKIPDDVVEKMQTVGDVIEYIKANQITAEKAE